MKLNYGILDFGVYKPGRLHSHNVINALFNDIEDYEEMGMHRYWLSEHYSNEFSWYSPEMLLPLLAGYSNKINIGWTGVLLRLRSPLHVASNMRILSSIYNERIDLGIARAGAADEYVSKMYNEDCKWGKRVNEFIELINGEWVDEKTNEKIFVPPHATLPPRMWYLTNGNKITMELAARNKMNFVVSFMHPGSNYTENVDSIKQYKDIYFKMHDELPKTSVLACLTIAEDRRLADILHKRFVAPGFTQLVGSKEFIRDRVHQIHEEVGNDEMCFYMPYCDRNKRKDQFAETLNILNQ